MLQMHHGVEKHGKFRGKLWSGRKKTWWSKETVSTEETAAERWVQLMLGLVNQAKEPLSWGNGEPWKD